MPRSAPARRPSPSMVHFGAPKVTLESRGLKNAWWGVAILGILATTAVVLGTKEGRRERA